MATTTDVHNSPLGILAAIGIKGLGDGLAGGLTPYRLYLLKGVPGSGKTTLAMQFLMEGEFLGVLTGVPTPEKVADTLPGGALP